MKKKSVDIKKSKLETIAILNDIHFPFEDSVALETAEKLLKYKDPDMIVLNGDIIDNPRLSKYKLPPDFEKQDFDNGITKAWSFLSDLRREHPKAIIKYVEGNHEFRARSYVTERGAGEMYDRLYVPHALKLQELNIEWIGTKMSASKWVDTFFTISGGVHIGHFNRVNQGAGMTVRNLMAKKHGSFVQGHIHRAGIIYFTDIDHNVSFGMEVPCLCKDPFYADITDWQRGMGFLHKIGEGEWRPEVIVF